MPTDWQELTRMTGGEDFLVERVRLKEKDIAIEGAFDPPPLSALSAEDQVFVAAFVRSHGSIKRMEALFGISYPTVKNRLNRIASKLAFVRIEEAPADEGVLDDLEAGHITVDEALKRLES
jgi:hypothetical protein